LSISAQPSAILLDYILSLLFLILSGVLPDAGTGALSPAAGEHLD
jgi:hypothetical protein